MEAPDPSGAESAYGGIRNSVLCSQKLVAAALFRRAELLSVRGATARASAALARAWESVPSPQDKIWVKIDTNWQERPLKDVAEPLYRRLNQSGLAYRSLDWLAAHLPGSGVWRLLLGMVVLGLMLRVLEAPLFLKLVWSKGNTIAYRNFCIAAFAFAELVSIACCTAMGPDLVFTFGASVRWWVAFFGILMFVVGGAILALAQEWTSEAGKIGLVAFVYGVAFTSLFLWLLGPLSGTGLMGCLVMLMTGTFPAVCYAAKKS